ncbi:MarR family winged helix-turn-helix transcriptional regulator [Streptomyces orinoci]|uniref:MarR family transcriptional regulator n=1 Tax=Streptomyces orinoci TaxID=67339 RepID=A0ABV3K6K2_STRON|nr:MarR family transcriptional regulator [Streptomyces orinoci]
MAKRARPAGAKDNVDAVTRAVLTASRLLVAVSARSLAAAEDRVTLAQFRMLVVLSMHGAVNLVTAAGLLGVNPSTTMRMTDRLIAAGLVSRGVNPGNRRETVLRVTPDGQRIVEEVTARRRDEIAAIVARMLPGQREALIDALTAFAEAGGEPAAPGRGPDLYPLGWVDPPASNAS